MFRLGLSLLICPPMEPNNKMTLGTTTADRAKLSNLTFTFGIYVTDSPIKNARVAPFRYRGLEDNGAQS